MTEVAKNFTGDNQTRLRVFGIFGIYRVFGRSNLS